MFDALRLSNLIKVLSDQCFKRSTIGILFCRPSKNQLNQTIVNDIPYYHFQSEHYIDFFMPGYGAYWPPNDEKYIDQEKIVKIYGVKNSELNYWSYSNKMFAEFVSEIESISTWKYSGEVELLLLEWDPTKKKLDFSTTLTIRLSKAIEDKAIDSVEHYMKKIIDYRKRNPNSSVWNLSDNEGIGKVKAFLMDLMFEILPKLLNKRFREAAYFIVKNHER